MLLNEIRLKALEPFLLEYAAALTGSAIAKRQRLNQKSVALAFAQLEAEGFLRSRVSGKNRLFSLNLDDAPALAHFLAALEHLRTLRFLRANPLIKQVAAKLLPACAGTVLIFGSHAKGTATKDSDLDVFVIGSYDRAAAARLSETYRLPLSVKAYPAAAFARALARNDILVNEVRRHHIILTGAHAFASSVLRSAYGKE